MVESRTQIGFDQTGLGGVLKQYRLEVPPNQREYAWTDVEVVRLFQDLAKAKGNGDYFLGTIVTIPHRDGMLEVVDGQQRLATAAIFLAAIRDYLKEKDDESLLVQAIEGDFLTSIDRSKRAKLPHLKLNSSDNDLFNQIVTGVPLAEPTRESHRLLLAAYRQSQQRVRRIVAVVDPKDQGDLLDSWVTFIQHNALVVLLRVPDGADAYKMFETLNDRGLRTSQVDLIKNYLFGESEDRLNEVQAHWTFMRGTLESLDEEDITINFIRHALIVLNGHVTAGDVYDTVQKLARGEQGAVTFTATLEKLSRSYVATFNPAHELWNGYPDEARRSIEVFNLLNIRPIRPLLLAIADQMPPVETVRAFQFMISLAVRTLIASSTRSGSFEIPLATAAQAVFDGTVSTAKQLKTKLESITPSDGEFRTASETARVSNAKLARYYLRSLEMQAKEVAQPWFVPQEDREFINLEHILPRKPEDNWPDFSEDDVRSLSTRLGNLALIRTTDNSNLKSEPFVEKKKVYANSPYELTSQVAVVDNWTPVTISERQEQLAQLAVKAWPV
jgi:uncharacterized protein DUF262/uncharacterized protein DUF1524